MDINCDLGEGTGNDAELMPWIDLCNIACGGHAGDDNSMIATLKLAKQHGVKPGAHPSFVDREHFGRKELKVSPELMKNQLILQINGIRRDDYPGVIYAGPQCCRDQVRK